MKIYKIVFLFLIMIAGFAFLDSGTKQFEISKNLEIFTNLYKELNTHYVDDLDPSRLMRTGIESILETLDPYTNYISESDIESYRYMTEGKFDGIGARVRKMGEFVTIVEPYENGPAINAGLRAGDMIIEVNGKSAKGKQTDEVNDILRGFPGTEVTLTIRRPGEGEDRSVNVKRDEVTVKNVPYYGMLNQDIGYLVLTTFTANAGKNVTSAIRALKAENPNMKGLVFDLRNNGGGYLREAVTISNLFVPKDEIVVTTRGKVKDRDRSFKTNGPALVPDLPLVILMNKWTASASEIVSGVVQDLDRGILIGTRSYGKGLVQNTVDLDFNAKLKLTTSKYYIPSGRCIQSVRYKDGEPVDVPDKDRATFTTRGGRPVLDGGGITPDIKIDAVSDSPISKFLLENNLIFHYATQYHQTHSDIGEPANYEFTEFDDFIQFVGDQPFEFKTDTEKKLEELGTAAENENLSSIVKNYLGQMQEEIEKEKADDLIQNKESITVLLEKEIVSRYHYQTGKIKKSLRNDKVIQKAIEVLEDPALYKSFLIKK